MGRKSGRSWNYILYCFALNTVIVALSLAACAPFQHKVARIKAYHQLEEHRRNLAEGFFETVIEESLQIIEKSETKPPADIAFYALGEVYAHHDYRGRDYSLSKQYFEKLIRHFPESPLTSEAKTYLSLIESINTRKSTPDTAQKSGASSGVDRYSLDVKENLQVLKEVGNQKPADLALYNLGLIYAHKDNPAKDFTKSQTYFHQLTTQFPNSEYSMEAQVILGLFETIRQIQQIDIEIEMQRKKINR